MAKNRHNCKGCESRYVGCHSECPSYLAYAEKREEELKLAHKIRTESFVNDNVAKKVDKRVRGYFNKFKL